MLLGLVVTAAIVNYASACAAVQCAIVNDAGDRDVHVGRAWLTLAIETTIGLLVGVIVEFWVCESVGRLILLACVARVRLEGLCVWRLLYVLLLCLDLGLGRAGATCPATRLT